MNKIAFLEIIPFFWFRVVNITVVIEAYDAMVAFSKRGVKTYIRYLEFFVGQDKIQQGSFIFTTFSSWFCYMLMQETILNCVDEFNLYAIVTVRGGAC